MSSIFSLFCSEPCFVTADKSIKGMNFEWCKLSKQMLIKYENYSYEIRVGSTDFSNYQNVELTPTPSCLLGTELLVIKKSAGDEKANFILTVVRLAELLGKLTSATEIAWHPSLTLTSFDQFSESITRLSQNYALPLLSLIGVQEVGFNQIKSQGMAPFVGQEVCIHHYHGNSANAVKRLMRICQDIMTNGPIKKPLTTMDIYSDAMLWFQPSIDNSVVNVTFEAEHTITEFV